MNRATLDRAKIAALASPASRMAEESGVQASGWFSAGVQAAFRAMRDALEVEQREGEGP